MLQYLRTQILPSRLAQLLIQTGLKWQRDDCSGMSAALSYYALFSLFPILLIALSVVGSIITPGSEAFQDIQQNMKQFLPENVHDIVRETIVALNQSSTEAGAIGTLLLIYSATTVFNVLGLSVNKIWRAEDATQPKPIHHTVLEMVLNRLLAFLLVLGTSALLLASMLANIVNKIVLLLIANFEDQFVFVNFDELIITRSLEAGSSFLVLALIACILFKILPSVRVTWGDVWLGALLSAIALVGLQQLISNSIISIGSNYLSYGVVGSVMILLLWIYLIFQIFFIGCEFCYTYACFFGSRKAQGVSR